MTQACALGIMEPPEPGTVPVEQHMAAVVPQLPGQLAPHTTDVGSQQPLLQL